MTFIGRSTRGVAAWRCYWLPGRGSAPGANFVLLPREYTRWRLSPAAVATSPRGTCPAGSKTSGFAGEGATVGLSNRAIEERVPRLACPTVPFPGNTVCRARTSALHSSNSCPLFCRNCLATGNQSIGLRVPQTRLETVDDVAGPKRRDGGMLKLWNRLHRFR